MSVISTTDSLLYFLKVVCNTSMNKFLKIFYRILQDPLSLKSCIMLFLLYSYISKSQEWLIISMDLQTKAILYVQCVMIRLLILHATPFAVQWKFPTSPLTTVTNSPDQNPVRTRTGVRNAPKPNRSHAVPISDPHIQEQNSSVRHFESIILFNHEQNRKQAVSLNLIHLCLHSGWGSYLFRHKQQ